MKRLIAVVLLSVAACGCMAAPRLSPGERYIIEYQQAEGVVDDRRHRGS